MTNIDPLIRGLERARARLAAAAAAVPDAKWQVPPPAGGWSAAEVCVHLAQVETAIVDGARKILAQPPRPVSLRERIHWPIWMVAVRLVKAKTPIPLAAGLLADKATSLERLRTAREATVAFLRENQGKNLAAWSRKHPRLGTINFYAWFQVVALHEVRHAKQIQEIVETF